MSTTFDDADFPAYTMGRAADMLGVTPAFLRSLGAAGLIEPERSTGRPPPVLPAPAPARRPGPAAARRGPAAGGGLPHRHAGGPPRGGPPPHRRTGRHPDPEDDADVPTQTHPDIATTSYYPTPRTDHTPTAPRPPRPLSQPRHSRPDVPRRYAASPIPRPPDPQPSSRPDRPRQPTARLEPSAHSPRRRFHPDRPSSSPVGLVSPVRRGSPPTARGPVRVGRPARGPEGPPPREVAAGHQPRCLVAPATPACPRPARECRNSTGISPARENSGLRRPKRLRIRPGKKQVGTIPYGRPAPRRLHGEQQVGLFAGPVREPSAELPPTRTPHVERAPRLGRGAGRDDPRRTPAWRPPAAGRAADGSAGNPARWLSAWSGRSRRRSAAGRTRAARHC